MGVFDVLKVLGKAAMSYVENSVKEKFRGMSNAQLEEFVSDMEQKEDTSPQMLSMAYDEMRRRKMRRD